MITDRFTPPQPGAPTSVHFPPIVHETLASGLAVWVIPQHAVPLVSAVLVFAHGTADDPVDRPGLASLAADLLDEGAGPHEAIALADAFARLGSQLHIEAGADETTVSIASLTHHFATTLELMGDVVQRPHFTAEGLARTRDLRLSRLRQLSRSAATVADRAFVATVFAGHPYGHGALGTSAALESTSLEEIASFWATHAGPRAATLIVSGNIEPTDVVRDAARVFGGWAGGARRRPGRLERPLPAEPAIWVANRPGAQQSELRVGHVGPPRATSRYHALITLNALLGGQFTSRINHNLREKRAITYGARTVFDMRRLTGSFSCDTSVQSDATATAVSEILRECAAVQAPGAVGARELAEAQASLTRGYVRHFETAAHLARAAVQLVTFELDDDEFDRFVPAVRAVTPDAIADAAQACLHPADAAVIVVGDVDQCGPALEALGRPVRSIAPVF